MIAKTNWKFITKIRDFGCFSVFSSGANLAGNVPLNL